jgi:acetolactate synthase-1/2/3 large subunit
MVRQWQEVFYNKRYSGASLLPNPDFAKVAEAFGIMGIRVEEADEVVPALTKAMNHQGPAVIDFIVDECENVWPMVPSGAALDEMIGEDEYAGDEIGGLA